MHRTQEGDITNNHTNTRIETNIQSTWGPKSFNITCSLRTYFHHHYHPVSVKKLRMRATHSSPLNIQTLIFLFLVFSYLDHTTDGAQEIEQAVGYGYKIRATGVDSSGKSLFADLQLIKSSSVFGPYIQNLKLIAW